jgi:hypothetical protein
MRSGRQRGGELDDDNEPIRPLRGARITCRVRPYDRGYAKERRRDEVGSINAPMIHRNGGKNPIKNSQ